MRNCLAINKLQKLVYVHYNMQLQVKNLMQQRRDEDLYNPIDLNHIFYVDDILDSGYEKEKNLFYHLIIWIGWIKIFLLKKIEKQLMKMMVA